MFEDIDSPTVEIALEYLRDRVSNLEITCNVITTSGRQHLASFGYKFPGDEVVTSCHTQGQTILEALRMVCFFVDSYESQATSSP